jgi:DNA-binding transcriptional LysR family regulator
MDRLHSMSVFKQVVAENGFAAGARKLGLSPAQVTRMVKGLEDHLGVQLIQRTTRRLALTAAGESYLGRVHSILSDLEAAEEAAHSHAQEMSGSVRVLSLPGLPTHLVAPAIAQFRRQHPSVTVELRSDVQAARHIEGHDITLLLDHTPLPGDAVARRVVDGHAVLCASPDYLRRHGTPRTPQDLCGHALVRLLQPGVTPGPLRLVDDNGGGGEHVVHVSPVLTCNDHEAALRSTLEGAGISSQALEVAAPMLRSGQLQRVLAPWISERFTVVATFTSRRHMPPRIRAFLDHLLEHARQARGSFQSSQ